MKKLMLVVALLLVSVVCAERVKVVESCFLRSEAGALDNAGWATAGTEYQVLDVEGAFYEVKFTGGTKHEGKTGWIYRGMLVDGKVKGLGCKVRNAPGMEAEVIFVVAGGAACEVVSKQKKWYKIGDGKWIFHSRVKVLP